MAKKIAEAFILLKTQGMGQVTGALGGIRKSISGTVNAFAQLGLAMNGLKMIGGGLAAIATTPLKLAAEAEQIEVSMETLIGSADKAKRVLGDLYAFAAKTPFQFTDLSKASQTLLAFGEDADDLMDDIEMLSNIASGDANKLKSLALVFGQIQSTGRLMGQDLLQLINQGFNPLQIISQRTGESMVALKKRMEQGNISFAEVKRAFVDATSEGGRFYQMNERQSQTLAGVWSTLKDNIGQAMIKIGKAISEGFDLKGVLQRMATFISEMGEVFEIFSSDWSNTWEAMKLNAFAFFIDLISYVGQAMEKVANIIANTFKNAWDSVKNVGKELALAHPNSPFQLILRKHEDQAQELRMELLQRAREARAGGDKDATMETVGTDQELGRLKALDAIVSRMRKEAGMAIEDSRQSTENLVSQFKADLAAFGQFEEDPEAKALREQSRKLIDDMAQNVFRRREAERAEAAVPEVPEAGGALGMSAGMGGGLLLNSLQIGGAMAQAMGAMLDKLPKALTTSMTDVESVNRSIQESMEKRRIDLQKLQADLTKGTNQLLGDILEEQRKNKGPMAAFG